MIRCVTFSVCHLKSICIHITYQCSVRHQMLQRDWKKITRYDIVILLHVYVPYHSTIFLCTCTVGVLGAIIPAIYVIIIHSIPLELQHRRVSGSTMQQVQRKTTDRTSNKFD